MLGFTLRTPDAEASLTQPTLVLVFQLNGNEKYRVLLHKLLETQKDN